MRNRSRPVLHLPRTPFEKLLEALTALGIIAVLAMTVWGWLTLPEIIPTHYGLSGAPNAYGGKGSLLIAPIISICLAVLLTVWSRYPHLANYPWQITAENAPRQYYLVSLLLHLIALEMVLIFCGLQWIVIQAAKSPPTDLIVLIIPTRVLAVILTIILYIYIAARAR